MSATGRLRALLTERGVEWWPMHDDEVGYREDRDTEFLVYGCKHVAHEWGCRLQVDMLTPEQAIAATLGSCSCTNNCTNGERTGTCTADETDTIGALYNDNHHIKKITIHVMECSECGHTYEHVNGRYEFCPRCGRRIEVGE